jgi:hypothetical protein
MIAGLRKAMARLKKSLVKLGKRHSIATCSLFLSRFSQHSPVTREDRASLGDPIG